MGKNKRTLEIDEIVKLYQNGSSTTEISKLANISSRYVSKILSDQSVEKRPVGSWKRQYTVDQHYFKHWSANMAYILGFFAADGLISRENQLISFSQKEKEILEDIRTEIKSNHPFIKHPKTGVYALNIGSKIMKDDLMNLHGMSPNKSLDLQFPGIPNEYMGHFIRGYFDGDGYVNHERRSITFVGGSYDFLAKLKLILEDKGFMPYLKCFKDNHYRIYITGRKSVFLFGQWIYKDKTLYLKRKYNTFQKEQLDLSQISERKNKRTHAAVQERKRKFVKLYKEKKSINEICDILEIQSSTATKWLKNDKDLRREIYNSSQ